MPGICAVALRVFPSVARIDVDVAIGEVIFGVSRQE